MVGPGLENISLLTTSNLRAGACRKHKMFQLDAKISSERSQFLFLLMLSLFKKFKL